ncbi:MAG TPA: hypothetical protein VGO49_06910 [Bradyrhizobium sp.]|nr:hypothetical protein [Bradyrhizobium sp.]
MHGAVALFIDGASLYATAKTLGFDIDYRRLLQEFQRRKVLQINEVDASAVEGLRLVVAFIKITNKADRSVVIELAERLRN